MDNLPTYSLQGFSTYIKVYIYILKTYNYVRLIDKRCCVCSQRGLNSFCSNDTEHQLPIFAIDTKSKSLFSHRHDLTHFL